MGTRFDYLTLAFFDVILRFFSFHIVSFASAISCYMVL